MKIYILGNSPILPYLVEHLKDFCDIKVENNDYGKTLDVEKITASDLILEHHFVDAIILLDLQQIDQKIYLKDGFKTLDESVFKTHQHALWFTINTNDRMEYFIDKYNITHFNFSNISPFYITSKIALSDLLIKQLIEDNSKLLYQQKTLILGYNDHAKVLCEALTANRMIVIVSDTLLQSLLEAKEDGYGILLKEEINTSPIQFDNVIIEDSFFNKLFKRNDIQNIYYIDYKEEMKEMKNRKIIFPYTFISQKYVKLIGENLATSFKKEIRDYFKGE